jgi:hypothetical protein
MATPNRCFPADSAGCAPTSVDPDLHVNRPGLSALAYRRGTHASILERLLARLPSPLQGSEAAGTARQLNLQATDDPTVALLDAFAVVGDVLTFYQERIANECYLRTAQERLSVMQLASMLGYRPSPGVAASVDLAFVVDPSEKAPQMSDVPAGTRVLHIPGQDETPQPFETSEDLYAHANWNTLRVPDTTSQRAVDVERDGVVVLSGLTTGLRKHHRLLLVYGEFNNEHTVWRLHRLQSVTTDARTSTTRVTWDPHQSYSSGDEVDEGTSGPSVYALRLRTRLFGSNAPDWHTLPEAIQKQYLAPGEVIPAEWPEFNIIADAAALQIDLSQEHEEISADNLLVLADVSGTKFLDPPSNTLRLAELYRVSEVASAYRQSWRLTGQVSRLTLTHEGPLEDFGLRESAVWTVNEPLDLTEITDSSAIGPYNIEVVGDRTDLPEGRRVMVTGRVHSNDGSGAVAWETATVVSTSYDEARDVTTLFFSDDDHLTSSFERSDTVVYANLVRATHGETVTNEVLGSGDGSKRNQRFRLKRTPLTHVSDASVASGASSTLQIRVNGLLWEQVDNLLDAGPNDRVYEVQIDDTALTTVIFGDGVHGSRLPSGAENVVATYRFGIGEIGEVGEESISLLVKKPFGIRSVSNPVASAGSEDPETTDDARAGAPASVLTLQRVVSLSDYEDFARSFLGIGKAAVASLWWTDRRVVHLTVTDTDGDALASDDDVLRNLIDALRLWGDAEVPLLVQSLDGVDESSEPGTRLFGVDARVLVHGDYVRETVLEAVEAHLLDTFGASARSLAQPVYASEVIAAIHKVEGVIAVDLDALYPRLPTDDPTAVDHPLLSCLCALPARVESSNGEAPRVRPAELLVIDPTAVRLDQEMAP